MKNLKVVFALVFATIFMLTSCQKENLETVNTKTQQSNYLSGEELPTIESFTSAEVANIRQAQITSFTKEAKIGKMNFNETTAANSRSRTITDIKCGDVQDGTTRGETNTVDIYDGADKVYLLEMTESDKVTIDLSGLRGDLDLFLTTVLQDGFGRKVIGEFLGSSEKFDRDSESIELDLEKGAYFIIVETFDTASDFQLAITCENQNRPPVFCEDYQDLDDNYHEGISEQSNLWNIWGSTARDGLVLHETVTSANKVVKIDFRRFGYQDVVRDITGLPLTNGIYEMNFDLFTTSGVTEMLSEKTPNYGQEQGFKIRIDNGQLVVTHKRKETRARTRLQRNTWHNVNMFLDIKHNEIFVQTNGLMIIMNADARIDATRKGRKSIQGINFFGNEANSKFHVDNVCVTEYEPGYDIPTKITSDAGYEVIDLR